jgi:pSer/pThr/pTyr-binding forkhead associated (FHA) protein/NADPH-dependent 2,4-dienoyl-CoA reductase/sulfur reductase-like enzyme
MTTYLIVGDGPAGVAAAQVIRQRDPEATLTVISDDPQPHYYRAALTNYLLGQLRDEQLWGVPPDFYRRHRIGRFFGRVMAVDTAGSRVVLDSGLSVPYDRLLIASGATPAMLDVPGADLRGVMTFRTLQDARRIVDTAPDVRHAVIVGGGPLGLEWVQGLRHVGVDVTYVVRERAILPSFLDAEASELVFRKLRAAGVTLVLQDEIAEIHRRGAGPRWADASLRSVSGVTTKAGRRIPCQLVGVAIGARPNIGFLRGSAVETNRGVVTDQYLRTNVATVFAAGDVAHARDVRRGTDLPPAGLWQPARMQGQVAGTNLASDAPVQPYDPGTPLHVTHLYELDFAAVGEPNPRAGNRVEVLITRPEPDTYKKVVLRGGRVTGALFIGDRRGALLFKRLMDLGLDVSPIRDRLLDPHFDLAGWVHRQWVVITPQPVRPIGVLRQSGAAGAPIMRELSADAGVVIAPPQAAAPGERRLAARLTARGNVYRLPSNRPALIGRDARCDVVLGNSSVSRRHAEVLVSPSGYAVRDLGSTNGTWVGLTRLQPQVPQGLRTGDAVRFGELFLTFAIGEDDQGPAAGAQPAGVLIGPKGRAQLRPEVTNLGRDLAGDVVVPGAMASRLHAQIRHAADGALYLNDMGSVNGTFVNGARIVDAHRLAEGDVIGIGEVQFTFGSTGPPVPARPAVFNGVLIAVTGGSAGTRYLLTQAETVIGRDAANDIALNDPLVSRRHAVIRTSGGNFVVEDRGSRNGTLMNGVRLAAPRRLKPEDTIEIGQTRFVFRLESGTGREPPLSPEGPTSVITPDALDAAMLETRLEHVPKPIPVPVLVLESGPRPGLRFPFALGERAVIGRDDASAIVLRDGAVSRQHAQLEILPDGRAILSDLGSHAGTLVNGERLVAPRALQEGDRISIGGTILRFTLLA